MITSFIDREKGVGLIMVLAFIGLTVPLLTGALGLASTLGNDSRVKTRILKDQYSAIGGGQHANYRLFYEAGYTDTLQVGVESTYSITLNGEEVSVTVLKLSDPTSGQPPPLSDNGRRLQALKIVSPTTASPGQLTTYTYTITVENWDDAPRQLKKIFDGLSPGFSYVAGSTNGITGNDPSIELLQGEEGGATYQQLTWNVNSLGIVLQPGEMVSLAFDADASAPEGAYCNEAWADPGGKNTSSGQTAKITVGSPAASLCAGESATVAKVVDPAVTPANTATTYTYTIAIENTGTADLDIEKVRDLLPQGFAYLASSTSGDLTSADPAMSTHQGRERLDWDFDPSQQVLAGETKTLVFQASATVAAGDFWNEVWVTFDELEEKIYSWPTAPIQVMGVLRSKANSGDVEAASEVWVGSDSYLISYWGVTR